MAEIVIAIYKVKQNKMSQFKSLLQHHYQILKNEGLVTDRYPVTMKSFKNNMVVEVFEWKSSTSADAAHTNQNVKTHWDKMTEIAEFSTLHHLDEVDNYFPHFQPI